MHTSHVYHSGVTWRLPPRWTWLSRKKSLGASKAIQTAVAGAPAASGAHTTHNSKRSSGNATRASFLDGRRTADIIKRHASLRKQPFPVTWLLWWQSLAQRLAVLQTTAATSSCRLTSPSTHRHHHADTLSRTQRYVEQVLVLMERPARVGVAAAVTTLRIALQLGLSVAQLLVAVYLHIVGPRLRRFLRFALGIPFFVGTLFLLKMREWYFPEVGQNLDTSSVEGLPMFDSVDEAIAAAAHLQERYNHFIRLHRERADKATTHQKESRSSFVASKKSAPPQSLTRDEQDELLGAMFVLLRSIETHIVGTAEERELITARPDVLKTSTKKALKDVPVGLEKDDVMTATPTISETVPASTAATNLVSPAEYMLRVIMAISIAQGWSDITEHTRVLFQDLVRHKTPPVQSSIVQAVGELCSLSYELESGRVDAITLDQRRRIAAAIDAFRSESSVEDRCTIASEITVLPLPDFNRTTRCLGLIRRSAGRKPQLILCFVGTNTRRNWLTNFNYWPVPLPQRYGVVGAPLAGSPNMEGSAATVQPYVHRGFFDLVQTIDYKEVAADFDHVLLVGHSLGGALAQLAGLELATERPSRRITVITMASPRVVAVDWRTHWQLWRQQKRSGRETDSHGDAAAAAAPDVFSSSEEHDRDTLAELLVFPPNYRHFRGYLQPDVVPHLPPAFLRFTHNGQRIPLNTGCSSSLSFVAWGMYSKLYHSADLYRSVLKQPMVSQTHWYRGCSGEVVDVEEDICLDM